MSNKHVLTSLLNTPEAYRDELWEQKFLKEIPLGKVTVNPLETIQGPDHYPYLCLELNTQSKEPFDTVLNWCVKKGIGMVIHPKKQIPDYIFTYGMLWGFKKYGTFQNKNNSKETAVTYHKEDKVYIKSLDETTCPYYVREHLKTFLKQQGIQKQKVLLISKDKNHYDICFSKESLNNPPQKEYQGILEALSWFFPNHYQLSLISEKNFPYFKPI